MDDVTRTIVQFGVGGIGGAVVAIVGLRTRLAMMQRDIKDARAEMQRIEEKIGMKIESVERRQIASLRIMADIARKVGADTRWDDALIRFLTEDGER